MILRAAIYARYSTDKQDRTSIDDQISLCRKRAEALGLRVVATFSDAAVSGTVPIAERKGARAMEEAALRGEFDCLLFESLDRLSRDNADQEIVLRRLEFRGIRVIGISDGYDTSSGKTRKILRGVRGIVNEYYVEDLREKIRRGLHGQVDRGFHAGGMSYGYRSTPVDVNARGEASGYRLEIIPEQAAIVREIFQRYASGWSLQRIAADLNARGVRGPGRKSTKPSTWSVAALYGTPSAGSGLLNNEIYIGRVIWNRREWVRDPDDQRRRMPRMRPRSEWRVVERPDLRILSDEEWQAVRARMGEPRVRGGQRGTGAAPRTLFGGLLRCGVCGGAVVAVSKTRYGCAAHKDRGPAVCPGVFSPRAETERRLVAELRAQVLSPEAIAKIRSRVRDLLSETERHVRSVEAQRTEQLRKLEGEAERLADAIAEMGLSPTLRQRLAKVEAELANLQGLPAALSRPALPDGDQVGARIREIAMKLEAALATDVGVAREILARRLGPVTIEERDDGVYAQMEIGPVLLEAVGADSGRGCGGRI